MLLATGSSTSSAGFPPPEMKPRKKEKKNKKQHKHKKEKVKRAASILPFAASVVG